MGRNWPWVISAITNTFWTKVRLLYSKMNDSWNHLASQELKFSEMLPRSVDFSLKLASCYCLSDTCRRVVSVLVKSCFPRINFLSCCVYSCQLSCESYMVFHDINPNKSNTTCKSFDEDKPKHCFSSVQSLSRVQLFATSWIAACQASVSITNSRSSLKLMSIESVMPSSHLILGRPLLLLPPIPPSIRVFSNESALRIRWPKYWSFSFSIIPSKEIPGLISFRMD